MSDFETQLKDRMAASAARVQADDALYDRAEQRHRIHTRNRAITGGLGALAVVALATIGGLWAAGTLVDRPQPPIVQQPDLPTPTPTPEPSPTVTTHDGWGALPEAPLDEEEQVQAAAWGDGTLYVLTGVWVGDGLEHRLLAFEPGSAAWTELAPPRLDGALVRHAVWTGRELLVVGQPAGYPVAGSPVTVASFDPVAGTWRASAPAPSEGRDAFSVTWTGDELILWGGLTYDGGDEASFQVTTYATGAAFDPRDGSWRELAASPLLPRGDHGAVWNGRRFIVFGGGHTEQFESEFFWDERFDRHDAAAYDPLTDTWTAIQSPGEIGPLVASAWTGNQIVYWSGHLGPEVPGNWREPGRIWDPVTGDSSPLPAPPFDQRRDAVSSRWVEELEAWLVWGGSCGEGCNRSFAEGGLFDPQTGSWTRLAGAEGIVGYGSVGVWGDDRLFAVGGSTDFLGAQGDVLAGGWWRPSG